MKLAILAMVVISTTAQLSVVDIVGQDAVAKLKDSNPHKAKIEDSKDLDAVIGDINITGNAIKSNDTIIRIVKIDGKGIKAKMDDTKPVAATVGAINIASKAIKYNDTTLKAINFAGNAIKTVLADFDEENETLGKADIVFSGNAVVATGLDVYKIDGISDRFSSLLSRQCAWLQKMARVAYEEVKGTAEPELDKLKLTLFSNNQYRYYNLGSAAASLPLTSVYNSSNPLVIFMHGFTDNPTKHNFQAVNGAFQKIGNFNILALDASPLIRYLYLRSSTYVRLIGERLGAALAAMIKAGLKHKDIHLVGHSLGAHTAGFTGKTFHSLTGSLVGRITGLDPAGPCFSTVNDTLRLKSTDAEFVDVIHTDAGVYGLTEPVGHADYFPNGGAHQPSCYLDSCSHSRAVDLFAESVVRPDAFLARACKDWNEFLQDNCKGDVSWMGYRSKPGNTGLFYLRTGNQAPYGLGTIGLSPKDPVFINS